MSRALSCLVTSSLFASSLLALGLATPAAAASSVDYVALGDSYSSGVGSPGQTGLCLQSPNGYPGQWVSHNQPRSYLDLACSGAETSDVLSTQAPFIPSGTDLISITIGGNDAGFASTVLSCEVSSDSSCVAKVQSAESGITATLGAKLDATYTAIRARAPHAKVVVLGYPLLFDTSSANCGLTGIDLAKRNVLNQGAGVLDSLIATHAAAAGFTWTDVRSAFAGHGVCSASPYLNGLTIVPPQNSFHPNVSGYTNGYFPAFSAAAS